MLILFFIRYVYLRLQIYEKILEINYFTTKTYNKEMRKNIKLFNPYAISSLKYANRLSIHKNQRVISGDNLFWGIYQYIRNHQHFDLFCNVT